MQVLLLRALPLCGLLGVALELVMRFRPGWVAGRFGGRFWAGAAGLGLLLYVVAMGLAVYLPVPIDATEAVCGQCGGDGACLRAAGVHAV